jgi:HlyD family secretion protein
MIKKQYLWIGGGALLAAAAVATIVIRSGGDELQEVQTASVDRQKITQMVNATGRIQPKNQVKISADVSAKIARLGVEEGDWVEEGQFLVELDRERHLAQVESAEANVRSAKAEAKLVRENMIKTSKEYDRSSELVRRGLESQSVLDTQQAAYLVEIARHESALDQVEQAKAALKQTEDALSKTTIYAPMTGTISDLRKEQGEIAIGSQFQEDVILVISDLTEMEAQVNVDENDIVSVIIGQEAEIEVDALFNRTLKGQVYEIANSANVNEEGTTDQKTEFEVKIAIIDPLPSLRPGMTASANVFTKTNEHALSVPIQSVAVRTLDQLALDGESREDAEKSYTPDRDGFVEIVFSIDGDRAVAKQVTTGIQSDELIEILSGLGESEEVVTGSYRAISKDLVNGAEVTVNNNPDRETEDG